MKLMTPLLFALSIILVFSYQESQANNNPKRNEIFGSSKFSTTFLTQINKVNNPGEFYSIQGPIYQSRMFNSSLGERLQVEDLIAKKKSQRLRWLGLGAFWWAAFFDHYQDAIQDRGGKSEYLFGANHDQWHLAKNLAHIGYLTSGFAVGMELERGNLKFRRLAYRVAGGVLIYWFIQVIVYDKASYDVWFDYKNEYREHGPLIFDLKGKDHRIKIAPWARPIVDLIKVAGGMYLVIKY